MIDSYPAWSVALMVFSFVCLGLAWRKTHVLYAKIPELYEAVFEMQSQAIEQLIDQFPDGAAPRVFDGWEKVGVVPPGMMEE